MSSGSRILVALFLGLALACAPEREEPVAEVSPTTEHEKTIYALGLAIARNLSRYQLTEPELDQLKAGLTDAVRGREPKVALEDYRTALQTLAHDRQEVLRQAEAEKGSAWLAEAAAQEGAVTTESGLVMKVTQPAEGPSPNPGDRVKVHYHGLLRDGTVFDSSVERGQPAVFPLGRMVPCWKEALALMSVGEKVQIWCPASLAYGARGRPPHIQPGASLGFEIELLEIVQRPVHGGQPPQPGEAQEPQQEQEEPQTQPGEAQEPQQEEQQTQPAPQDPAEPQTQPDPEAQVEPAEPQAQPEAQAEPSPGAEQEPTAPAEP